MAFRLVAHGSLGPTLPLPVLVGPLATGQGPEQPIEPLDVHGLCIVGLYNHLPHMVGLHEVA